MVTIDEVKTYLKIDNDITDDDIIIDAFIQGAEAYLKMSLGSEKAIKNKTLAKTAMFMMIESWYRPNEVNINKYAECITSIVNTLAING